MRYLVCPSEAPLNPGVQVLESPAVAKQISQLGAAGQAMVAGENPDEPPNSAGSNVLATIQVRPFPAYLVYLVYSFVHSIVSLF